MYGGGESGDQSTEGVLPVGERPEPQQHEAKSHMAVGVKIGPHLDGVIAVEGHMNSQEYKNHGGVPGERFSRELGGE